MLLRFSLLSFAFFIYRVFPQNGCPENSYTELDQVNCTDRANETESYYFQQNDTSCVPHCEKYDKENLGRSCEADPCPPAYNCEQRCQQDNPDDPPKKCTQDEDCRTPDNLRPKCKFSCVPVDGGCMSYHANTFDFEYSFWTAQKFKPECNNDGTWKAKQCKGGLNGRCMCYGETGTRLFGEALKSESEDMTCACSRRRAELMKTENGKKYVTIHCDADGNYEKLQCNDGICWCAEPKTGDPTAPVVPERAVGKLPCYSKMDVGEQYLRQCDSKEYAIAKLKQKLNLHGVRFAMTETMRCDWDGAFGRFMIVDTNAYCTWRNDSKIGTWQADVAAYLSVLNCNCARDFVRYGQTLACKSYGNYEDQQTLVDDNGDFFYYCVDSDGFAKTNIMPLVDGEQVDCSIYY